MPPLNDGAGRAYGIGYETQSRIFSDKLALFVFIFFLISILVQAALLLMNWSQLPPEVPIFYSKPWGEAMLGPPIYLWILPTFTILFFIINYFIAIFLLRENYFLNRVLIVFSAIISFATLYDMSRIIGLLV